MSNFSYAYLLLDITGVLLCAVGFKFALLYLLILARRGVTLRGLLCLTGNLCLMLSGILLVWMPAAWNITLLYTGAALAATMACGKLAHTRT